MLAATLFLSPTLSPALAQAPDFSAYGLSPEQQGRPQKGLAVIPVTLHLRQGRTLTYQVEVAATPAQQATGMMFRRSMAPRSGMLFPMDPPRDAAFWMRNTLIPLDLVFIAPDSRIIRIHPSARPLSDAPLQSGGPVKAVLELAGGEAARIGLRPGDRVSWQNVAAPL